MIKSYFDIETSPNHGYTWGKWEQNVIKFTEERHMISFSWGTTEKDIETLALCDFPKEYKRNPKDTRPLARELHSLMQKAQVVVAHNGDEFDLKRARTEFIKHRLKPIFPFKTIDTLKIARKLFDFNSNKLDDLGEFLGVGRKVKHPGFEMWEKCMEGDMAAWKMMKLYNAGDVKLLMGVEKAMAPWMTNHPNMNKDDGHVGCTSCRSVRVKRNGWSYMKAGIAKRYQCLDCGHPMTGKLIRKEMVYA